MKLSLATIAALVGISGVFRAEAAPVYADGVVTVYATAKDTGERLAKRGEVKFVDLPQPSWIPPGPSRPCWASAAR